MMQGLDWVGIIPVDLCAHLLSVSHRGEREARLLFGQKHDRALRVQEATQTLDAVLSQSDTSCGESLENPAPEFLATEARHHDSLAAIEKVRKERRHLRYFPACGEARLHDLSPHLASG